MLAFYSRAVRFAVGGPQGGTAPGDRASTSGGGDMPDHDRREACENSGRDEEKERSHNNKMRSLRRQKLQLGC